MMYRITLKDDSNKTLKVLVDQETFLEEIDKMVSGSERERIRVAVGYNTGGFNVLGLWCPVKGYLLAYFEKMFSNSINL